MRVFKVGGAVRDGILGLPIHENDWLVVGASVKQMVFLGYKQVGQSFPVFIHPESGEEYALARKEQKIKPGHTGFKFEFDDSITLEEDLLRRDLTINAIVKDERGVIQDPVGGKKDLKKHILRHISDAFVEDPLRVLRVARFKAKLSPFNFKVAPETLKLMQKIVKKGELATLSKERIWKELYKALITPAPVLFFDTLQACGARFKLFPELNKSGLTALIKATELSADPGIRFAALMFEQTNFTRGISYKAPKAYVELAKMVNKHYKQVAHIKRLSTTELLNFLLKLDALRRPKRFQKFLVACEAVIVSKSSIASAKRAYWQSEYLDGALSAIAVIDLADLLVKGLTGKELAVKIKARRIEKLTDYFQ